MPIDAPANSMAKPKVKRGSIPKGEMSAMKPMEGDVGAYRTMVSNAKGQGGFKGSKPVHASEYFPVRAPKMVDGFNR